MKSISQLYMAWSGMFFALCLSFCIAQPATASGKDNPVISGTVFHMPDTVPFENVTLSFSGIGQVITDGDGYYEMAVPTGWDGMVTPSVCDEGFYDFDPPSITYVDVVSDIQDQHYHASTDTSFTISGIITDKYTGEPLANTQVTFEKETGGPPWNITVVTNDTGAYSFVQPPCWTNSVNPGIVDGYYYLEPFTREYTGLSGNMENQDYTFVNYEKPVPPEWEYVQTGDAHIIAIENTSFPNLCGVPLELGDLIGVFFYDDNDELKCGGFGRWQDENNVALIAQGDDDLTQIKEGFDYFEVMNWRTYSYSMDENFVVTPEYKTGGFLSSNNKFVPGGLSIVTDVDAFYSNLITIPAGWSGLSSYTMPDVQPLITKIMEPIIDDLVIVQTMDKVYYPAGGINNLLIWNYNKGYKIKVAEETYLPMHGCQEPNTTINLSPTWNLLPVLSECAVDPAALFAPVMNELIMLKQVAGTGVYWPAFGINTLGDLEPGRAYYAAVTQNTSVTYEDCEGFKQSDPVKPEILSNNSPWEVPLKSHSTHTVAIKSEALNAFEAGDYIGVFDAYGSCFGITEISDNNNISLACFGDDLTTVEKEGFAEGDPLFFRAWKAGTGEMTELRPEFDSGYSADGRFAENGISVINALQQTSAGTHDFTGNIRVYPNPATDQAQIVNPTGKICTVTISGLHGSVLTKIECADKAQLNLAGYARGVYILKVSGSDFNFTEKLILK